MERSIINKWYKVYGARYKVKDRLHINYTIYLIPYTLHLWFSGIIETDSNHGVVL